MSNENVVYEKIEKMSHDKEFIEKMSSATTVSEIQSLLKEKGIEVNEAEAQQIIDKRNELIKTNVASGTEIDEEALSEIVGGNLVIDVAKLGLSGVKVAAIAAMAYVVVKSYLGVRNTIRNIYNKFE